MNETRQFQQGDVCITPVNLNTVSETILYEKNLKPDGVLREGEATGHAHRLTGVSGVDFELYRKGAQVIARILRGNVQVVHEEHGTIDLPMGDYEITPVHEFDHIRQAVRVVRD